MNRRDILLSVGGLAALGGCSESDSGLDETFTYTEFAKYYVTDITLSKKRISPGESITVRITVENRGDNTGSQDLAFYTDSAGKDFGPYWMHSEGIEVPGGESEEFVSTTPPIEDPGEYSLELTGPDHIATELSQTPTFTVEG